MNAPPTSPSESLSATPPATGWTAVIPVKAWARAKTRLAVSGGTRAEFARAVALDTLDAVAASTSIDRIIVVSDEPGLAEDVASADRLVVLLDPPGDPSDQLNDAIRLAGHWAQAHATTRPVVVVPADLAALTTADLDAALEQLSWFARSHVPDHRGRGTTLSAAARPDLLDPRYGPASERAHAAVGSVPILDVPFEARLDVDCLDDLPGAATLGLGRRGRTTSLARRLERAGGVPTRPVSPAK